MRYTIPLPLFACAKWRSNGHLDSIQHGVHQKMEVKWPFGLHTAWGTPFTPHTPWGTTFSTHLPWGRPFGLHHLHLKNGGKMVILPRSNMGYIIQPLYTMRYTILLPLFACAKWRSNGHSDSIQHMGYTIRPSYTMGYNIQHPYTMWYTIRPPPFTC